MSKPKWKALVNKQTGKYLTGYTGFLDEYDEVEIPTFYEELVFKTIHRGRSSVVFEFVGTKQTYTTGTRLFEEMIPHMKDGRISGTFTFKKLGSEIYLKLVAPK